MTKEQIAYKMDDLHRHEVKFLESDGYEKNEHGAYIYESSNKNHSLRLDGVLRAYKEWLIEKGIVIEKIP